MKLSLIGVIGISVVTATAMAQSTIDSGPRVTPSAATALAELGRALFFDAKLSADRQTSCASCHQPAKAFQDGRATAQGAFGQIGTRNTPSLLNVAAQSTLFWDGRRRSLGEQALDPLLNNREHGLRDRDELLSLLAAEQDYRRLFAAASQAPGVIDVSAPNLDLVTKALVAFETQLVDGDSPFDKFRYRGEDRALTASAQRGWSLFSGRARCTSCHIVGERPPALFTDQEFHALPNPARFDRGNLSDVVNRFMAKKGAGISLDQILISDNDMASLGRFAVTQEPSDIAAFKTPSLRNVALTAPYMHDGSVRTLEEVVDLEIYYRGTQDGRPLILTDSEKSDLLAFLHSLTAFRPPT